MKNVVKYVVLGVSCIVCALLLAIMVAWISDVGSLSYPATLILPMISYAIMIAGFVMLTVWAFKFAGNKPHTASLIISLCLMLASVVCFYGVAKPINRAISGSASDPIEVKNGFLDISVDELEKSFNKKIDGEYSEAQLQKEFANEDFSFYSDDLENGIELNVLAAPDATKVQSVDLSCDMVKNSDASKNLGYYFAKLLYTVAPDITGDEILSIAAEIKMDNPIPGDRNATQRGDLLYSMEVSEDFIVTLFVLAYK